MADGNIRQLENGSFCLEMPLVSLVARFLDRLDQLTEDERVLIVKVIKMAGTRELVITSGNNPEAPPSQRAVAIDTV
jgi:hypothetical protein